MIRPASSAFGDVASSCAGDVGVHLSGLSRIFAAGLCRPLVYLESCGSLSLEAVTPPWFVGLVAHVERRFLSADAGFT